MPMYDTQEEGGQISIRLKSLHLVEQDIQKYGTIELSDQELEKRVRSHVAHMQANLLPFQGVLADDQDAFLSLLLKHYSVMYRGLLVGYTGLREPFRLTVTPRYTTRVAFNSEQKHSFTGYTGLLALLKDEQVKRRTSAEEDERTTSDFPLTFIQVSIDDAEEAEPSVICYTVEGDAIVSVYEQVEIHEDVLRGLGLPLAETFVSAKKKGKIKDES